MAHFTMTRGDGWPDTTQVTHNDLGSLDAKVAAAIDWDNGGTYSPLNLITFSSNSGGALHLTGPLVLFGNGVSGYGKLSTTGSTLINMDAGDFPQLDTGHVDSTRVLPTPCIDAKVYPSPGARPNVEGNSLVVVATSFLLPNGTVQPTTWRVPLRVANGSTITSVAVGYRPRMGSPMMRVERVDAGGTATPLTSSAAGADANGFVKITPTDTSTEQSTGLPAYNTATIPVDGGASRSQAIVDKSTYTYWLRVVEDQTLAQTYPNQLPLKAQVRLASTLNLTYPFSGSLTVDGTATSTGDRVLIRAQTASEQNGIYIASGSAWTYATDADIAGDARQGGKLLRGTVVPVYLGGENQVSYWQLQELPQTLGSSKQTWMLPPEDINSTHPNGGFLALGNIYYQAFVTCSAITDDRWQ